MNFCRRPVVLWNIFISESHVLCQFHCVKTYLFFCRAIENLLDKVISETLNIRARFKLKNWSNIITLITAESSFLSLFSSYTNIYLNNIYAVKASRLIKPVKLYSWIFHERCHKKCEIVWYFNWNNLHV